MMSVVDRKNCATLIDDDVARRKSFKRARELRNIYIYIYIYV